MELTTPVGRIVWGQNPLKPNPVLDDNKQPKMDKLGNPRKQISFGIAIPKAEFQASVWPSLYNVAAQAFNNSVPPTFAYKYVDGDGIDANGQPYAAREGYAGNIVLTVSTEVDSVPLYQFDGTKYNQLAADALKCGDYVAVGIEVAYNNQKSPNKPGLYINPKAVELIGYGAHIVSRGGADPAALFGGRQHQLPPGASATPVGGAAAMGMPGMAPMQPQYAPPPAAPVYGTVAPGIAPTPQPGAPMPYQAAPVQPQYAPQAAPMQAPVQPAYDFVQPGVPMQVPGAAPQGMPGMAPAAAPMQPGQMPGFMPPR